MLGSARYLLGRKRAWLSNRLLSLCLLLCSTAVGCASRGDVVRRRGDVQRESRAISPVAYAWYVRGLYHERAGDLARAARDFGQATRTDPRSGNSWAAWGRVLCDADPLLAGSLFAEGLRRSDRKAPLYLERAACTLRRHQALSTETTNISPEEAAREDAQQALRLEPKSPRASALLAECYRALNRPEDAASVERAFALWSGRTLDNAALRGADHGRVESDDESDLMALDEALWSEDLEQARTVSLTLVTPGELAARAALWGKTKIAKAQATFVLAADPFDPDAQVVLLFLGVESDDFDTPDHALSPSGLALFAQHLSRTVGPHEAMLFVERQREALQVAPDPFVESMFEEATSGHSHVRPQPVRP